MNNYKKNMLDKLLEKDKLIYEYWSHAASYLPLKHFRFSLIRKKSFSSKHKTWGTANKKTINRVYGKIKSDGPLMSKNFEDNRKSSAGWWEWKPSKDALDYLFHSGKIMVTGRKGFQKIYDLTERVLPDGIDLTCPTEKEYYGHLILSSIIASGIVSESDIMYLRKYDKSVFGKVISELLEEKKIIPINVKGEDNTEYYTFENNVEKFNHQSDSNEVYLLSPFDNLVINRKKLFKFFGFDFQLECYLPKLKRKFGYFCLPVLYKNSFIGRIDLKADKKEKTLLVHKVFFEENKKKTTFYRKIILKKLNKLAEFCGCTKIKLD